MRIHGHGSEVWGESDLAVSMVLVCVIIRLGLWSWISIVLWGGQRAIDMVLDFVCEFERKVVLRNGVAFPVFPEWVLRMLVILFLSDIWGVFCSHLVPPDPCWAWFPLALFLLCLQRLREAKVRLK